MAGLSEAIEAARVSFSSPLSDLSKVVGSLRFADDSGVGAAAKAAWSPVAIPAIDAFASVNMPADAFGISHLKLAESLDSAVGDHFGSLSKLVESAAFAEQLNSRHSIASALGAMESAVLVKNLVPDSAWVEVFGRSSEVNAMLAKAVTGLPTLAADIAGATDKFSTISLPRGKWFENIDLGINSWSNLVRMTPPRPSPHRLEDLSLVGTGALAVAESGLILADPEFSAENSDQEPFAAQRERFRASIIKLGPDLIDRLDGAWERVGRPGPDAASQAAHSLVEFIDWTLRRAAPDEAVARWHEETHRPSGELDRSGRATRALRIRYIMRDRVEESEAAEMQVRSITGVMQYLQKKKHAQGDKELRAVERMIPGIEAAFTVILPWDIQ